MQASSLEMCIDENMKMKFKPVILKILTFGCSILLMLSVVISKLAYCEIINVDKNASTFYSSGVPTPTLYWPGQNPQALLIYIPGGSGTLGLKESTLDLTYSFYQTLKSLTNPQLTSGRVDVVLLDFPRALEQNNLAFRDSSEHLTRIARAIEFYHQKTGLPIWLMGHSNGGVSLGNYIRFLQKYKKTINISGLIASSIRNESSFHFEEPLRIPVLFLHHQKDQCASASSEYSMINYERVKRTSANSVDFKWITQGDAQNADPCKSGYHMYFNSGTEASKVIDEFMAKHQPNF